MARRKRREEEADWVAPDFDEVEYMRREVRGTQAAVATILWAIVGAIVAFLLYSVLPALAFFAGIAVGFGLYFILPLFGIKTDAFKRRDWTGHGITYFFSWLAFWIILLNPPFGDFTDPTIQGIAVSPYTLGYTGDLPCLVPSGGQVAVPMGPSNNSIYVLLRATDNSGLATLEVTVTPASQTGFVVSWNPVVGKSQCKGHTDQDYPAGSYNVTFAQTVSSYTFTIVATDRVGRTATASVLVLPQP